MDSNQPIITRERLFELIRKHECFWWQLFYAGSMFDEYSGSGDVDDSLNQLEETLNNIESGTVFVKCFLCSPEDRKGRGGSTDRLASYGYRIRCGNSYNPGQKGITGTGVAPGVNNNVLQLIEEKNSLQRKIDMMELDAKWEKRFKDLEEEYEEEPGGAIERISGLLEPYMPALVAKYAGVGVVPPVQMNGTENNTVTVQDVEVHKKQLDEQVNKVAEAGKRLLTLDNCAGDRLIQLAELAELSFEEEKKSGVNNYKVAIGLLQGQLQSMRNNGK